MSKPILRDAKPAERLSRARQRAKLIDACITALHQHGPSRTTIDKVVTIADMSPGIVNFYFETKAALLVAALEHLAVEFETHVLEPLSALRQTPMVALDRLIDLYLDPDVASARKVSVWYSFWGESSSRREYYTICGKRDLAFAALVQDLVARVINETGLTHLDADAISLGLIGCLEMMWQEIAFQDETDADRQAAKKRCRAYLQSVFPGDFGPKSRQSVPSAAAPPRISTPAPNDPLNADLAMFRQSWQFACTIEDLPQEGDYVAWQSAIDRVLILRGPASTISAFVNTCLHRPHLLVPGESGHLAKTFTCSADATVYGLDGVRHSGGVLQPLHVAVHGPLIFVTHAAEHAGEAPRIPLPPSLSRLSTRTLDVAADWPTVMQHWADAYFDSAARTIGAATQTSPLKTADGSISRTHLLQGPQAASSPRLYLHLCAAIAGASIQRTLIWPNLFIETRPDGITIRQVLPLAPGRSRLRSRNYGPLSPSRISRTMSYLAARMERAWERDDVCAIETTQAASTAAEAGTALSAFTNWLIQRVG